MRAGGMPHDENPVGVGPEAVGMLLRPAQRLGGVLDKARIADGGIDAVIRNDCEKAARSEVGAEKAVNFLGPRRP